MAGKPDKESLLESPYFCMMPWVHFHLIPDSSAHLCCISDIKKPIGKFTGDFQSIYNSPEMKDARQRMLTGQPVAACERCYSLERNKIYSLRQNSLTKFTKYFDEVEQTGPDGSVKSFRMRYLDIRFNNGCNFRCQTCGPTFSTAWQAEHKRMHPNLPAQSMTVVAEGEKLWSELEPSLLHVEEAYFAGGEPLITDEIYKIMDYWIEKGHFDHDIGFTTNFSNLSYKGKNIIDYWRRFPKLVVSASIDDSGERGEYLRKGTKWSQIEANRELLRQELPYLKFELTPTISIYNIWHFPEFHWDWLARGYCSVNEFRLNILTDPSFMSIGSIPPQGRKLLIERWNDYIRLLDENYDVSPHFNKTMNGYRSVVEALEKTPYNDERRKFFQRAMHLDAVRSENLYSVYPELEFLLQGD